jgi:DNA-binding MarR family transcriptional regulator
MSAQDETFEFVRLISGVNRQLEQSIEARLKPAGVSIEHYRVLDALVRQNGLPMTDLARQVFVDGPTLTKIIDRMMATSDVYRAPDSTDRRKVLIFLSQKGQARYEELYGLLTAGADMIMPPLGRDVSQKLRHLLQSVSLIN